MDSIFIETSETLGLLYNRYHKIPDKIDKFMDDIEAGVDKVTKSGPSGLDVKSLSNKLEEFKDGVKVDIKEPEVIDVHNIKQTRKSISDTKNKVEKLLDRLGAIKRRAKFGDNWIKGILRKPRVYQDTIDDATHDEVNKVVRILGRSMDWIEKIILDVMNLADQDLNLLSLVKKVYYRTIFEDTQMFSEDYSDILNASIEDLEENFDYTSYFLEDDELEPPSENNIEDIMDQPIDDDEPIKSNDNTEKDFDTIDDDILDAKVPGDERYYPIFSIVYSYDFDQWDTATAAQRAYIKRGKAIKKITMGDEYSHSLVSLDTSLENMYHIVGRGIEKCNLLTDDAAEITKSIYVSVTFLTKEEIDSIKGIINDYYQDKDNTFYDGLQLVNQLFGSANHKDKRQICSTFMGYLLAKANAKNVHRDYSLIRPEDATILPRSFYVMTFKNSSDFVKRKQEFRQRVQNIYNDNIDEIREYNNILPKIVLKDMFKKKGTIDKIIDHFAKKLQY